eukprot:3877771-Rhodomonas_salina.1
MHVKYRCRRLPSYAPATPCPVLAYARRAVCLCLSYAVSGTEIGYGAMAYQVSIMSKKGETGAALYCDSVWCYAVCGTETAYGAMRSAVLK